jgi:hypothetical protein
MTDEDREDALRYAARLRGLSLIRMAAGSFALARYECTGATLDEIEAYLGTDGSSEAEHRAQEERRQAQQQSMLDAQIEAARRRLQEEADRTAS